MTPPRALRHLQLFAISHLLPKLHPGSTRLPVCVHFELDLILEQVLLFPQSVRLILPFLGQAVHSLVVPAAALPVKQHLAQMAVIRWILLLDLFLQS